MSDKDIVRSEHEGSSMKGSAAPVISSGTRVGAAVMGLILLVGGFLDYLHWVGKLDAIGRDSVQAGLVLTPLAAAAIVLVVARSFARGEIRTEWMLFGFGMLSVGIGSVIWVLLFLLGKNPYPSFGDVFTLGGYALFAVGLYLAVRGYRELLDIRRPLLIAGGVAAALMALDYFAVIGPYVIFAPDQTQPWMTRFLNTLYPVLDIFILLMPAIALGLLVRKLGSGRLAWPWWCVVASCGLLAITDTVFAYAGYAGIGRTPIIDSGYAVAPMLLALAVLVARDVYRS